jgi:hypothetical protein
VAERPAVEFLQQALDRAEGLARAAGGDRWSTAEHPSETVAVYDSAGDPVVYAEGSPSVEQAAHIALNDPAAVLRRVALDRQILAEHAPGGMAEERDETECRTCSGPTPGFSGSWPAEWPCRTVLLLAEAYGWTEAAP